MLRFCLNRLVTTLPVLAVVAVAIFMLAHLAPGDPAALIAGDNATPAQIAAIREKLRLDLPLWQQFAIWVGNLAQLDLSRSIYSGQPVTAMIGQRLEPTLVLAVATIILATVLAVPLGALAAWQSGGALDRFLMFTAVAGFSVPVFVTGYALMYIFALELEWFPVQGYKPLAAGIGACLASIALPSLALAGVFAALIARVTRATVLEILGENYIRTARAKGAGELKVVFLHALKNAAVPVLTVIGVGFAVLVGGVVVTETVFNIPGLGRLTADAVLKRDYPVVQGTILFFSALLVLINLLVDLSYALVDPRIRYDR
jgi:peptide/nickel transport system permease protein